MKSLNKINLRVGKLSKAVLGILLAVFMVPNIAYCAAVENAEQEVQAGIQVGISLIDLFPNKVFAKYVYEDILQHQDWDNDGADYHITDNDVNAISNCESIDVASKECKGINGIEHFTRLKYLNCSDNYIETINVSNCHDLETLICDRNRIYDLDVTGCPNLKKLICSSNPLRNLNLNNCFALHELDCSGTQIDSLDVLNCEFITSINISNCNNLYGIVDLSGCSFIESINVSNCSNLYTLDLSGCLFIESVNVSNCSNLYRLNVINAFNIKFIDASKCGNLEWINISPQVKCLEGFNIYGAPRVRCNLPVKFFMYNDFEDMEN